MTATAIPLALVWVIILLTSPSMAAALGIDCANAAAETQNAADNRTKSGRSLFHILMGFLLELHRDELWFSEQGLHGLGGHYASKLEKVRTPPKALDFGSGDLPTALYDLRT